MVNAFRKYRIAESRGDMILPDNGTEIHRSPLAGSDYKGFGSVIYCHIQSVLVGYPAYNRLSNSENDTVENADFHFVVIFTAKILTFCQLHAFAL